jgi:hypothetical protein
MTARKPRTRRAAIIENMVEGPLAAPVIDHHTQTGSGPARTRSASPCPRIRSSTRRCSPRRRPR